MVTGLGGWIAALVVGLICYLVSPHTPHPVSAVLRIIGIVCLVVAVVLFALWLIGLLTGSAVVGMPLVGAL